MLRAQEIRHLIQAVGVDEDAAQHRLLRFQAVGQIKTVGRQFIVPHSRFLSGKLRLKSKGHYSLTITVILAVMPWLNLISAS